MTPTPATEATEQGEQVDAGSGAEATEPAEPAEVTEPAEGTAADADSSEDGEQPTEAGDHVAKLRRESAKYRTRAQDAETQLADMAAQVAKLQRALVAGQLQGVSIDALEAAGVDIGAMIGEDGGVDADSVSAASTAAREKFGFKLFQGSGDGGHRNEAPARQLDWAEAMQQQLRR